ncbi:hypothetical protein LOAG_06331, partial [Loa loa]
MKIVPSESTSWSKSTSKNNDSKNDSKKQKKKLRKHLYISSRKKGTTKVIVVVVVVGCIIEATKSDELQLADMTRNLNFTCITAFELFSIRLTLPVSLKFLTAIGCLVVGCQLSVVSCQLPPSTKSFVPPKTPSLRNSGKECIIENRFELGWSRSGKVAQCPLRCLRSTKSARQTDKAIFN